MEWKEQFRYAFVHSHHIITRTQSTRIPGESRAEPSNNGASPQLHRPLQQSALVRTRAFCKQHFSPFTPRIAVFFSFLPFSLFLILSRPRCCVLLLIASMHGVIINLYCTIIRSRKWKKERKRGSLRSRLIRFLRLQNRKMTNKE